MSGLIAIVGRPNVGKSALFNRLVGKRIAIVHDEPGVTRDRITAQAEWRGHPYTLIDTGGIGLLRGEKSSDVIVKAALDQVELAIEASHVIILVVNVQEGIVPLDREVTERLRRSGKPVLVAVNKVDNFQSEAGVTEFAALGFAKLFPVSAIHGEGISALVDAATALLPSLTEEELLAHAAAQAEESGKDGLSEDLDEAEAQKDRVLRMPPGPIKLAIVGRPNVGKSSIINALTNSERVIVTPIPGTTRDAVDVPFEVVTEGVRQQYVLIDTAGVRSARRAGTSVDFFSIKRTEESIARSDVVIYVMDAQEGITVQDKKLAGKIVEERKACIIVINKWDLVKGVAEAREKELERLKTVKKSDAGPVKLTTLSQFGEWVQEQLYFLDYAPVIFTSASTGFHLDRLLESVRYISAQLKQHIPTALLNRALRAAIERRQPVSSGGHRLKFFYATQVKLSPPTFLLFVNRDDLFSDAYRKYLADEVRTAFGYEGCPVQLVPKARLKTIEPKRRFKKPTDQNAPKRGGKLPPGRSR